MPGEEVFPNMTGFSTASPGGGEPWEEKPIRDLARDLRQGIGVEWRAELEATELEIHQDRLRQRTMSDIADMVLHRGDMVTLQTQGFQVCGEVVGCGEDYVTVNTDSLSVDARLDRFVIRVSRRSCGGTAAAGNAPTWRARLTELELTQERVELLAPPLSNPLRGRIRVVSLDHVWLIEATGIDCYLPLQQVNAVVRRIPPK